MKASTNRRYLALDFSTWFALTSPITGVLVGFLTLLFFAR